jgi:hypothetical protein
VVITLYCPRCHTLATLTYQKHVPPGTVLPDWCGTPMVVVKDESLTDCGSYQLRLVLSW